MSLWKIRKMKIVIKFFYFLKILLLSFLNSRLISVSENVVTSLQYDPLESLFPGLCPCTQSPTTMNKADCIINKILQKGWCITLKVWVVKTLKILSSFLLDRSLWGKPVSMPSGHSSSKWRGPYDKGLRTPANTAR